MESFLCKLFIGFVGEIIVMVVCIFFVIGGLLGNIFIIFVIYWILCLKNVCGILIVNMVIGDLMIILIVLFILVFILV